MSDGLEGEPRTRWSEVSGGIGAATAYQQRFDDLAASGVDIHGEAAFVEALLPPPARVLDAGCGTGRVATQLTALAIEPELVGRRELLGVAVGGRVADLELGAGRDRLAVHDALLDIRPEQAVHW